MHIKASGYDRSVALSNDQRRGRRPLLWKEMVHVRHVSIGFYFLRKVMIVAYTTIYHCVIIPGAPPLVPCKGRSSL